MENEEEMTDENLLGKATLEKLGDTTPEVPAETPTAE